MVKKRKLYLSVAVIFVFAAMLAALWFAPGGVRGGAESGLMFHDLRRVGQLTNSAWSDLALGMLVGVGVAGGPMFSILSYFLGLGVSPVLIQAAVYFVLLLIAGLSIFYLAKLFFPKIEDRFALLATLFYWFNLFSLVNAIGRNLDNYKFFFAVYPLLWLIFVLGLKKRKHIFAVVFALASVLMAYSFTFVPSLMLLWLTLTLSVVFYATFSKKLGDVYFYISYLLLSIIGFLLVNYWWIRQMFGFVSSEAFTASSSAFFSNNGNLATLSALSKRLGIFVNNLRFMHGPYFYESPDWSWARIYVSVPAVILEFLVAVIILGTIYRFRKNKEVLFLGVLFSVALFLMKGNGDPFGEVFQFWFETLPFLQVFRNPFEKIGFLLALSGSLLLAFGIWRLTLVRGFLAKYVFKASFLVLAVFYGFPFWTSLVFTNTENNVLRSNSVKVPEYYKAASDWVDTRPGVFRFVSLPIGGEAITYDWERDYLGVELSGLLFKTPNVSFNSTIPYFYDIVSELSRYQTEADVLSFFPFINAKYVVLREDIDFKAREMPNPEMVKKILGDWEEQGLVAKRLEIGRLTVYEINKDYFWPKIYLTQNKIVTNSGNMVLLSGYMDGFPKNKVAFLNETCLERCRDYSGVIYSPEKVYFQKVSSPLPRDLSDEELLGKLFYSRHLPGDFRYPFIRLNERILEVREKDYDGWILYKIGIMGKRAAEIYKLEKNGAEQKLLEKVESEYFDALMELEEQILALSKTDSPTARVVKDSLVYQWVLLERSGLGAAGNPLPELLSKWNVKSVFELPISDSPYIIANFALPVDGYYSVKGAEMANEVYVDGVRLGKTEDSFFSKTRDHEVALLVKAEDLYENVVEQEEAFFVDSLQKRTFGFSLSEHPSTYAVEFDYRFSKGEKFQVNILQDIEDRASSYYQQFDKNEQNHEWVHFDGEFSSLPGSRAAKLIIEPSKENLCRKLWWGWRKCENLDSVFRVEIRNLKIRKVNVPDVFVVARGDSASEGGSESRVIFNKYSSTRYVAHVEKKSDEEELLVFSELYNPNWKATYAGDREIPSDKHFLVNSYANGWLIDKKGEYDVVIDYQAEVQLNFGKKVSAISVTAGVGVLCVYVFLERRRKDA